MHFLGASRKLASASNLAPSVDRNLSWVTRIVVFQMALVLSPWFFHSKSAHRRPEISGRRSCKRLKVPCSVVNTPAQLLAQDSSAIAETLVDWLETKEAHIFRVDLPGVSKDDIRVTVEDGRFLQVSGERKRTHAATHGEKWHQVERSAGRFLRQFKLPKDIDFEKVDAVVADGVLTVTIAKVQEQRPRIRRINVSFVDRKVLGASQNEDPIQSVPDNEHQLATTSKQRLEREQRSSQPSADDTKLSVIAITFDRADEPDPSPAAADNSLGPVAEIPQAQEADLKSA